MSASRVANKNAAYFTRGKFPHNARNNRVLGVWAIIAALEISVAHKHRKTKGLAAVSV